MLTLFSDFQFFLIKHICLISYHDGLEITINLWHVKSTKYFNYSFYIVLKHIVLFFSVLKHVTFSYYVFVQINLFI